MKLFNLMNYYEQSTKFPNDNSSFYDYNQDYQYSLYNGFQANFINPYNSSTQLANTNEASGHYSTVECNDLMVCSGHSCHCNGLEFSMVRDTSLNRQPFIQSYNQINILTNNFNSYKTGITNHVKSYNTFDNSFHVNNNIPSDNKENIYLYDGVNNKNYDYIHNTVQNYPEILLSTVSSDSPSINQTNFFDNSKKLETKNCENVFPEKKIKKRRHILKKEHQILLETAYQQQKKFPYFDKNLREKLAKECGIQSIQVRKWLSNRRNKDHNTRSLCDIAAGREMYRTSKSSYLHEY